MASKSGKNSSGAKEVSPDHSHLPAASESNEARKRKSRLNITFPVEVDGTLRAAADRLGLNRRRNKRKTPSSDG